MDGNLRRLIMSTENRERARGNEIYPIFICCFIPGLDREASEEGEPSRNRTRSVLAGILFGVLVAGIALAVVITMYTQHCRYSDVLSWLICIEFAHLL